MTSNEIFSIIHTYSALPVTIIFFGIALFFSIKTRFAQFRYFPHFISLLTGKISREYSKQSISPFRALLTAMSTTLGMGNIVGPSIAIMTGGPGALFWLLLYLTLGATIKFTEVILAIKTRRVTPKGDIIGGPSCYLSLISPYLGLFYTALMILLLLIWTSLQANTLAEILALEGVPTLATGIILAFYLSIVLYGGIKRVSNSATILFPFMFLSYVIAACIILARAPLSFKEIFIMMKNSIFCFNAAIGATCSISLVQSMRTGILRGIFISEAGIGTASIPHAIADTKHPFDQAVLAMCATVTDIFLCLLSGLITLKSGIFESGIIRSTLVYEAFRMHSPLWGKYILGLSTALFVITTIVGNSFNALQNFHALTNYKFSRSFIFLISIIIIIGAQLPMIFLWELSDLIVLAVAIPHLFGLLYLFNTQKNLYKNN